MKILDYRSVSNQKLLANRDISVEAKLSLVICFYKNFDFLEKVLASLEVQTEKNFEVIIADDGSPPEVVQKIYNVMMKTPLLIQHLWHADDGWKKVEMLNKALVMSLSDYIVTIDQDCVLHPEFVAEHLKNRSPGHVLSGRRAEFTSFINSCLTLRKIRNGYIQKNYWWMFFFMFYIKDNQWFKGLYFRSLFLRQIFNRKHRALVGCNMSFYKQDLIKINGYDMKNAFPCGAEDADIEYRMIEAGYKIKSICHIAVQYHLFHPFRPSNLQDILKFYRERREEKVAIQYGVRDIQPVPRTYL